MFHECFSHIFPVNMRNEEDIVWVKSIVLSDLLIL